VTSTPSAGPAGRAGHRHRSAGRGSRAATFLPAALAMLFAHSAARAQASAFSILDPVTAEGRPVYYSGNVLCVTPDGHGGLFLGGAFQLTAAPEIQNAAHLAPDGSFDAWNPAPNGPVTGIFCSDSTVFLGGTFTSVGGVARTRLAAVSATTALPTGWAPTADAQVACFARIADRVFVGGAFSKIDGISHPALAALDANTGAVLEYRPPVSGQAYAMAVRDTELFAGGEFGVLALSPTTARLSRTIPRTSGWVGALAVSGEDLYVGGGFGFIGSRPRTGLAAVNLADNSLEDWDPLGGVVKGLAVTPDYVYACGTLGFPGGGNRPVVARLSRTTARSAGWAPQTTIYPAAAVQLFDGGVFVATAFQSIPVPRSELPKPMPAFPELNGPVYASLVVGDTLFLGGSFGLATAPPSSPVPYTMRTRLAAVRISTGELLDWTPYVSGTVRGLRRVGSSLIVFGSFTSASPGPLIPGTPHGGLALFDLATGDLDPWDPAIGATSSGPEGVYCAEADAETLYVGGRFSQVGGVPRGGGCSFDLRTRVLTDWNPDVQFGNGTIEGLVPVGPRVVIGGGFSRVGGLVHANLAEVDTRTGAPGPWTPGIGEVRSLVRANDAIYAAGDFSIAEGQYRGNGAAYRLEDHALLPWNPHSLYDVQFMGPLEGGLVLATNSNYLTNPPIHSLLWVDTASGAPVSTLPIYTSDRIWTASSGGGIVFVGGVFNAISASTDHGYFAALPGVSLPTPVVAGIEEAWADGTGVHVRAVAPGTAPPALERRIIPGDAWIVRDLVPAARGGEWFFEDPDVAPGRTYAYRLVLATAGAPVRTSEVLVRVSGAAVADFAVGPVIPNPNAGRFTVYWTMPAAGRCEVEVLDVAGRRVSREVRTVHAGEQQAALDLPASLPPGLYVVRLRADAGTRTRRFCLVR